MSNELKNEWLEELKERLEEKQKEITLLKRELDLIHFKLDTIEMLLATEMNPVSKNSYAEFLEHRKLIERQEELRKEIFELENKKELVYLKRTIQYLESREF